ncbi:MAG TPA: cell division protein FtsH, partial [Mycobacteriales bacterium]|nr:cell division protein FtsH [Mycobacteriales bacterium]
MIIVLLLIVNPLVRGNGGYSDVDTSKALAAIQAGDATKITQNDKDQSLDIELKNPVDGHKKIHASYPAQAADEVFDIAKNSKADFNTHVGGNSIILSILLGIAPFIIVGLLLLFLMGQMQGGGSRVMNFGKSKAKLVSKDTPKTTFADV